MHSSPFQSSSSFKANPMSSSNLSVGRDSLNSSEGGQPLDVMTPFSNLSGNNINTSCASTDLNVDTVDAGGCSAMSFKARSAVEQLQIKIDKTQERIKLEQNAKEDNVNEYLKLSNDADKQQLQRIKAVFEKKNIKSAQVIAHLQRKLEEYDKKLREISLQGTTGGHKGSKGVLKDMGQGLRVLFVRDPTRSRDASPSTMQLKSRNPATLPGVSKTKENSHAFKNKYGSADNIASSLKLSHQELPTYRDEDLHTNATSTNRDPSDDDISSGISDSLTSGECYGAKRSSSKIPEISLPTMNPSTSSNNSPNIHPLPQQQDFVNDEQHQNQSTDVQRKDLATIITNLTEFQEMQFKLHCSVDTLKAQLDEEGVFYRQALEEEHDRCERLEEQINDLTELHQNEMYNIKQEMVGMQEKMEYQLEERTRDIQELLLTCQTRINKMELQQQQQQLISMEGIENTSFRGLATKLINIVLALLAVVLVLVSEVANLIGPFLQTRLRIIGTALLASLLAVLWNRRTDLSSFLDRFSIFSNETYETFSSSY